MALDEEQARAAAEVAARLRQRGIALTGAERPDDLADLLSAVGALPKQWSRRTAETLMSTTSRARSQTTALRRAADAAPARLCARTSSWIDEAADGWRRHPRQPD